MNAVSERANARLEQAMARRVQTTLDDEQALEDMKTWGFSASNIDVARVMIEDALVQAGAQTEMTGLSIMTGDQVEMVGPTRWLQVEIEADLRWTPVFAFLDMIAARPEGFRIVAFSYEMTRSSPLQVVQRGPDQPPPAQGRLRLRLSFPVVLEDEAVLQDASVAG